MGVDTVRQEQSIPRAEYSAMRMNRKKLTPGCMRAGRLVSPRQPVEQKGLYWGYSVRFCASLAQVLTECPWSRTSRTGGAAESSDGNMGYDLVIGTSERGTSLTDILNATNAQQTVGSASPLPAFDHVLVMFGGLSGLEVAVERDRGIQLGAEDAHDLCDAWVNVVEGQGSRTVRTEVSVFRPSDLYAQATRQCMRNHSIAHLHDHIEPAGGAHDHTIAAKSYSGDTWAAIAKSIAM